MSPSGSAQPVPGRSLGSVWVTIGSLVAVVAGLVIGIAGSRSPDGTLASLVSAVEPVGRIWIGALWMAVLPFMASMLVVSVASTRSSLMAGRLGMLSTITAVTMIGTGLIVTVIVVRTVIATWPVDPVTVAALRAQVSGTAPLPNPAVLDPLTSLNPGNFIRAAADGNLVALLVCAALTGLLITWMPSRFGEGSIRVFQAVHDATQVLVRAILQFTPLGVFSLTLGFAARAGIQAVGAMSYLLAVAVGLLLLYTAACYPLVGLAGGVSIRRFAVAVFPAQVVALSTRSSVAAIPLLLDGCHRGLGVPLVVARFVLPMMVSVFKFARAIGVGKLLVLAHLYGVEMAPATLLLFVLLETATGGTPGMPQTGVLTAPAYVAAGIPLEGLLLFNALETVIDFPKTVLNVTGAMTASAIVSRLSGLALAVTPTAARMPDTSIAPAVSAR